MNETVINVMLRTFWKGVNCKYTARHITMVDVEIPTAGKR